MALKIFSLLTLLVLKSTGGAASVLLPPDLAPGVYSGNFSVDPETGYATYTYLGTLEDDAITPAAVGRRNSGKLDRRLASLCTGYAGSSIQLAQERFVYEWGYSAWFQNPEWVSVLKGDSQAYACVWKKDTTFWADEFLDYMESLDDLCGTKNGGWIKRFDERVTFGRAYMTQSICQ